MDGLEIKASQITIRGLESAIPAGATAQQSAVLEETILTGAGKGANVNVIVIP